MRSGLIPTLQETFQNALTTILDITLCRSQENPGLLQLLAAIFVLLLFPIVAFAHAFVFSLMDLLGKSRFIPADAPRVPTFYVARHRYGNLHALLLIDLGSLIGAIHCAGWNIPFPTYAEQKLWRVASLAVTTIPIPLCLILITIVTIFKLLLEIVNFSPDGDEYLIGLTFSISVLAYAVARLVLLGLAVALLRHLPESAYTAVDWTKFYPHIL